MSQAEDLCPHCGAPRVAGFAACKFCKTPFVKNTQTNAIPCPRCNTLNEMGGQKCVQCQAWIVVQCVFCHALSPHNAPACLSCHEAFAGAPQRLQQRQQQQHVQQGIQIASSVGGVLAPFLGAAAGAALGGSHSHGGYYEEHHHHHHGGGGYGPQDSWPQQPGDYDSGGGAGIADTSGSSGPGFFDSLFGGSSNSDSGGTGAGISDSGGSDSGGSFWDSSDDDNS
jgi:hypothetical protein